MLFKLIATIYLVVNGVAAPNPSAVLTNHNSFSTMEDCMNFFDTEKGKAEQLQLNAMLKQDPEKEFKAEFECKQRADGSI